MNISSKICLFSFASLLSLHAQHDHATVSLALHHKDNQIKWYDTCMEHGKNLKIALKKSFKHEDDVTNAWGAIALLATLGDSLKQTEAAAPEVCKKAVRKALGELARKNAQSAISNLDQLHKKRKIDTLKKNFFINYITDLRAQQLQIKTNATKFKPLKAYYRNAAQKYSKMARNSLPVIE